LAQQVEGFAQKVFIAIMRPSKDIGHLLCVIKPQGSANALDEAGQKGLPGGRHQICQEYTVAPWDVNGLIQDTDAAEDLHFPPPWF
jgi:hypothetical protein